MADDSRPAVPSQPPGAPGKPSEQAAEPHAAVPRAGEVSRGQDEARPELDLLVWDAPNVDMTLANVIGGRPTPASRPRFDAVARWVISGAEDREVEGCVFANVPPGAAVTMRGWVEAIRSFGYAVFARPKLGPDDDVDADMIRHIWDRAHSHRLFPSLVRPRPP